MSDIEKTEQLPEQLTLMEVLPLDERNIVKKANSLIEGHYTMSRPESKIMEAIISVLKDDAKTLDYVELDVRELCEFVHITIHQLKECTRSMLQLTLEFVDRDANGEERLVQTHWLNDAIYYANKGKVRFRISQELAPYLCSLKKIQGGWTSYNIMELLTANSVYTQRIYELAVQYAKIGHRIIEIAELKKMLGIEDDKYKQFSHFRTRVLDPAMESIAQNMHMKYNVSYCLVKIGRFFTQIQFEIKPKIEKDAIAELNIRSIERASREEIIRFLRGKVFAADLIEEYSTDQLRNVAKWLFYDVNHVILDKFLHTRGYSYVNANAQIAMERYNKNGQNFGALFFAACTNNYAAEAKHQEILRQGRPVSAPDRNGHVYTVKDIEDTRKFYEQEKREKDTEPDDLNRILPLEIEYLNASLERDVPIANMFLRKYKDSPNPYVQAALNLIRSGQPIPKDMFDN